MVSELETLYPGKVILYCVKEGPKLKIKIVSSGYIRGANCQFPTNIRVKGYYYALDSRYLQLSHRDQGKAFYTAMSGKNYITVINNPDDITKLDNIRNNTIYEPARVDRPKIEHIYEDVDNPDCIVCLVEPKTVVYAPCGHHICCVSCTTRMMASNNKCPMCKSKIVAVVPREMVE